MRLLRPSPATSTTCRTALCNIYNGSTRSTNICEIYIRNPEIYEIGSGTKLLVTFLSLRFFDMRRESERHSFLLCWLFHLTPPRAAHFVDPNWSRRGETKNRLPSSRLEAQLTVFFFLIPKSSALPGMTSFTSPVLFPLWGFYWDICDWPIRPARVNNCTQSVHLTNPCTKRKVLSQTKPKGKVYKTKYDNIKKIPPQLYYTCLGLSATSMSTRRHNNRPPTSTRRPAASAPVTTVYPTTSSIGSSYHGLPDDQQHRLQLPRSTRRPAASAPATTVYPTTSSFGSSYHGLLDDQQHRLQLHNRLALGWSDPQHSSDETSAILH